MPKGFEKYFPKSGKNGQKSAKSEPKSEQPKEAPPKQSKPSQSSGQSSKPSKDWKFDYNFNFGGKGDEPNKWTNIALVTTLGVLGKSLLNTILSLNDTFV